MTKLKEKKNIPEGWKEKNLGEVCDIVNGSTPKRSISKYWENGNIPWFTIDDIRSNGRIINKTKQSITNIALKETSVKLLPEDSILLCCTASLGEVALTKIPLTTNQQFNGLISKDKENVFPHYLYYFAQKIGEGLKSKSGKTTINFLSVGSLSKEKVLLPPIKEQQKIAEILGAVDEDISKTKEVIATTKKLKKALMQQLFTRGIGHIKFKQTEIGEIPESWSIQSLNSVASVIDSLHKTPKFSEGGFSMVRVSDIKTGNLNLASALKVPEDVYKEFTSNYEPKKGDLVLSRVGSYGVSSYVATEEKFCMGQNTVVINSNINSKYVYYALNSDLIKNQIENQVAGSGYKALSLKSIRELKIPVPENGEEIKIAKILSTVDEKVSVNKKLLAKLTKLKKGLMQDLLSGKVRVKI